MFFTVLDHVDELKTAIVQLRACIAYAPLVRSADHEEKNVADTIDTNGTNNVELATELTVAWLSNANTRISADDVPTFLQSMYDTVSQLAGSGSTTTAAPVEADQADHTPAVSVRKSLASKDHIVSMIDGKPYKTLRRHLATNGLTPEEYRARYNLKADYPMVAESYSESRRAMAKKIGLGRKPKSDGAEAGSKPAKSK